MQFYEVSLINQEENKTKTLNRSANQYPDLDFQKKVSTIECKVFLVVFDDVLQNKQKIFFSFFLWYAWKNWCVLNITTIFCIAFFYKEIEEILKIYLNKLQKQ